MGLVFARMFDQPADRAVTARRKGRMQVRQGLLEWPSARPSLRGEHLPAPAGVHLPVGAPLERLYGKYGAYLAALSRLSQPATARRMAQPAHAEARTPDGSPLRADLCRPG